MARTIKAPKKVLVDVAPPCDICALEFSASEPQPAQFEGPMGGPWANACDSHGDNLTYKAVEYVVEGQGESKRDGVWHNDE